MRWSTIGDQVLVSFYFKCH